MTFVRAAVYFLLNVFSVLVLRVSNLVPRAFLSIARMKKSSGDEVMCIRWVTLSAISLQFASKQHLTMRKISLSVN